MIEVWRDSLDRREEAVMRNLSQQTHKGETSSLTYPRVKTLRRLVFPQLFPCQFGVLAHV